MSTGAIGSNAFLQLELSASKAAKAVPPQQTADSTFSAALASTESASAGSTSTTGTSSPLTTPPPPGSMAALYESGMAIGDWMSKFSSFVTNMFGTDQWSAGGAGGPLLVALAEKNGIQPPPGMNLPEPDSSTAEFDLNGGSVKITIDLGNVSSFQDVKNWVDGGGIGTGQASKKDLETQLFGDKAQSAALARNAVSNLENAFFGKSGHGKAEADMSAAA